MARETNSQRPFNCVDTQTGACYGNMIGEGASSKRQHPALKLFSKEYASTIADSQDASHHTESSAFPQNGTNDLLGEGSAALKLHEHLFW